jgi:hypothetical protein
MSSKRCPSARQIARAFNITDQIASSVHRTLRFYRRHCDIPYAEETVEAVKSAFHRGGLTSFQVGPFYASMPMASSGSTAVTHVGYQVVSPTVHPEIRLVYDAVNGRIRLGKVGDIQSAIERKGKGR